MINSSFVRLKRNSGFTLVEVLISMVIFSLLMILVSVSINFVTRYWQQENSKLDSKLNDYILFEKLSRSITAVQPYGVYHNQEDRLKIFFWGKSTEVTFVSNIGIKQKGPVIVRVNISSNNEQGTLIRFAEQPLDSLMLQTDNQLDDFDWNWQTVQTNLVSAEFNFYGYESILELQKDSSVATANLAKKSWYKQYYGHIRGVTPKKILLNMVSIDDGEQVEQRFEFDIEIDDHRRFKYIASDRYVD